MANAIRLARVAAPAFGHNAERFLATAASEAERAITLAETQWRIVDPDVLDIQQAERAKLVEDILSYTDGECAGPRGEYAIKLGRPYSSGNSNGKFFYTSLSSAAAAHKDVNYRVARFQPRLAALVAGIRSANCDFVFVGVGEATRRQNSQRNDFQELNFTHVSSVRMRIDVLGKQAAYRRKLEADGWSVSVSSSERRELEAEAKTAGMRAHNLRELAGKAGDAAHGLTEAWHLLRVLDTTLSNEGVLLNETMPMGQRYLQSPRYAAVLKAYRALDAAMSQSGIGFETLDRVNEVGVLHASALYERWCLIKIIAVLTEDYCFQPPKDWQTQLVSAALDRKPGAIWLRRPDLGISACVQYQPTLPNGRQPDFIITFPRDDDPSEWQRNGLVLDAKFRTQWKWGGLQAKVTELCEEKGYGRNDSKVFVVHPIAKAIRTPTSPLAWGRDCDHGQDKQRHRRGSIALAAGTNGLVSRLNLKRLIALELQSLLPEPPSEPEAQDEYVLSIPCIQCGARHSPGDLRAASGRSGWDLHCRSCHFTSWRTYCHDCQYPIFKNGIQMTYHRTLAHQITNVACPSCGYHFSDHSND